MELRNYIEKAEEIVGGPKKLAEVLNVGRTNIPDAKAGRRGLPALACWELASLIGEDERIVQAASEIITEKDEKKRDAWLKHASKICKLSSVFMAGACFLLLSGTPDSAEARMDSASVTLKVTQTYRNATILSNSARTICIMSNLKSMFRRFGSWLSRLSTYFRPLNFQG